MAALPTLPSQMADLTETANNIFFDTLRAIDPDRVIRQELRLDDEALTLRGETITLRAFEEVVLIGFGKAAIAMGAAVESILGERIKRGLLVSDYRPDRPCRTEVIVAGHPLPDANSLVAAEKIIDLTKSCTERSLIIFLISGGGSALVEMPLSSEVSLEDLRAMNQILVGCGASIREINIVRKHLSRIKGGRLGAAARNSQCLGLYFSDVNPGDIRSIASNPILPEKLSRAELLSVTERFGLNDKLPPAIVGAFKQDSDSDSPRSWSWSRQPITAVLLDNSQAIQTAADLAKQRGLRVVEIADDLIEGDYRLIAEQSVERLIALKSAFPDEPVCLLSGGEVSCPVRGGGVGGRNQEFVLYCAALLNRSGILKDAAVLSCGTDGIDGNSDAAGASASPELIAEASRAGDDALSYLRNSDSNSFFKNFGGLVITGHTGNNVRDLRILLAQ